MIRSLQSNNTQGFIFACLLLFSSVASAGFPGTIHGFFVSKKGEQERCALSGALIALYRAKDNTLVGYTYSTDKGTFDLEAPTDNGEFYLVATLATNPNFVKKEDFSYNPQKAPPPAITLACPGPEIRLRTVAKYLLDKLDAAFGVLVGLLIGKFMQWRDEKGKAPIHVTRLQNLLLNLVAFRKMIDRLRIKPSTKVVADHDLEKIGEAKMKLENDAKELIKELNLYSILIHGRGKIKAYSRIVKNLLVIQKDVIPLEPDQLLLSPEWDSSWRKLFTDICESFNCMVGPKWVDTCQDGNIAKHD